MNKKVEMTISSCIQGPFYLFGQRYCQTSGRKIDGSVDIPDWCLLPTDN